MTKQLCSQENRNILVALSAEERARLSRQYYQDLNFEVPISPRIDYQAQKEVLSLLLERHLSQCNVSSIASAKEKETHFLERGELSELPSTFTGSQLR